MPIYEYECQDCHKVFEEFVSSYRTDDSEISCPDCKTNNVKKRVSAISLGNSSSSGGFSSGASCSPGGFS